MTDYLPFTNDQFLLSPDQPELPYRRRTNEEKKNVPWGQRKLFCGEQLFINRFCHISAPIFVYAGAAPGKHIPLLAELNPEIEFHLYDPKPFQIESTERIHLYQQYFTDDDAKKWTGRTDVYFISDIRTADYTQMTEYDNESAIIEDMELQKRWYNIIQPVQGHLKFRLPYATKNMPTQIEYFDGYVFKQPWAPQTSTETRLVPYKTMRKWDIVKYESQMFYHNIVVREQHKYLNPVTQTGTPVVPPELLNDYDSVAETVILMDYLKRKGLEVTVDKIMSLSQKITTQLNDGKRMENWYTLERLRQDTFLIKRRYATQDNE